MKTCLAEGCKLRGLYTDCGKSVKSSKAAGEGACAPQAGSSISACYNAFMRPLRISAISFLNTAPLMWDFENEDTAKDVANKFALSYTIPSRYAEELNGWVADIGIIAAAPFTPSPDLSL